jgi:Rod binding domain-containing protein
MDITSRVNPATSAVPPGDGINKPKNAPEAAQQFEALLLAQMLQAAHTKEDDEDSSADTMWDMAAQQFSQVLSKNGGLGLAKLITNGLDRKP